MIVISDSSPIIALAKVKLFYLLRSIFKVVIIPSNVYREIVKKGKRRPGAKEAQQAKQQKWLQVKKVTDVKAVEKLKIKNMTLADAESIVLAQEIRADFLLIDEGIAKELAIKVLSKTKTVVTGVGGFLFLAKSEGHVNQIKPIITKMREQGVWISDKAFEEILNLAGEL